MYYIIKGVLNQESSINAIAYVSSANKLKIYDGPDINIIGKDAYNRRKKLAVAHCKYMIRDDLDNTKLLTTSKKADDLADCYLQGVWCLSPRAGKTGKTKRSSTARTSRATRKTTRKGRKTKDKTRKKSDKTHPRIVAQRLLKKI